VSAFPLAPELKERWSSEGWCVVPAVIPAERLAAAQEAVHRYFPTPGEMVELGGTAVGEWHTWDAPWPEFPFHSSRLNAVVLHDHVVDLAEAFLGTDDLACYMGLVTAKYANQDSGYNQLLHADYPNHMMVVPRHAPGFQQVEFFVHLTDVTTEDGATRFASWQRTKDIPIQRHTLDYIEFADLYDDPSDAAAPAGSVVAYQPDVYHRSVDHTDPTRYRVMIHVCRSVIATPAGPAIKPGPSAVSPRSSPSTCSRQRRASWRCSGYPHRVIHTGTTRRLPACRAVIPAST
jgi:ectoine hydroxylase-related dioxygenase (phytanoyl-CoA dioxygenase family)